MYTSPGHTYAQVGVRHPAHMYVRGRIYFSCTLAVCTCTRYRQDCVTCYVRASTTTHALPYSATVHRCSLQTDRSTSMYVDVRDQTDNPTYGLTGWVPAVKEVRRHFLACEDMAGGSQLCGGESYFLRVIWTQFLACEDVACGSQQSQGKHFFMKYGGPSGGPRCQVDESLFCAE